MKIKTGYILRSIDDQHVVVPTGETAINFNGIITLNATGKTLFKALKSEQTTADLVKILTDTYDVDATRAQKDVTTFIKTLKKHGLLDA